MHRPLSGEAITKHLRPLWKPWERSVGKGREQHALSYHFGERIKPVDHNKHGDEICGSKKPVNFLDDLR